MTAPALALPVAAGAIEIVGGDTPSQLIVRRAGEVVGSATVQPHGGRLTIESLCIDEQRRGYGAGSAAARALIGAAREAGFASVRAWAPPGRGLAVYFWFRMGLHPLAGPGPDGGIWLERRLKPES